MSEFGNTYGFHLDFIDDITGGLTKTKRHFSDMKGGAQKAESATDKAAASVKRTFEPLKEMKRLAIGAFAAFGIREVFGIVADVQAIRQEAAYLFDESDDGLERIAQRAQRISTLFGQDWKQVLVGANTLMQENEISAMQAFNVIEEGFRKGANANDEFMQQLREYPAQLRQAGLTAREQIGLIAQSARGGVYSDKAVDAVKEFGLSIREMTQIQRDALEGLGMDWRQVTKDLNSGAKTTFDVMKEVIGTMKDANVQAKQTAIADLFKGAGEDAGERFLDMLGEMDLNLSNMQDRTTEFTKAMQNWRGIFSDLKAGLADSLGPAFVWFTDLAKDLLGLVKEYKPVFYTITAAVGAYAIGAAAAAIQTWALNAAFLASPVGWITAGIAGIGVAVYQIIENWDVVKGWLGDFWNWLKGLFFGIRDFVLKYHPIAILFNFTKQFMPGVYDQLLNLKDWFLGVFASIRDYIIYDNPIAVLIRAIREFWPQLQDSFTSAFNWIVNKVQWLGDMAMKFNPISLLWKALGDLFPGIKSKILEIMNWIYDNYVEPLGKYLNWIPGVQIGGDEKDEKEWGGPQAEQGGGAGDPAAGMKEWFDMKNWKKEIRDTFMGADQGERQELTDQFNEAKDLSLSIEELKQVIQGERTIDYFRQQAGKPTPTGDGDGGGSISQGLSGVTGGGGDKIKNITINIDRLVERIIINSKTLNEATPKIKSEVAKALIGAVNDVNYS